MKTSRSLSACLLTLVTLPVLAFSQDVKEDAPATAAATQPRVIDTIDTKNLTFGELIDLLRKESGENFNIVMQPGLEDEKVPQIVMRHVTVEGALELTTCVAGLFANCTTRGGNEVWTVTGPTDTTAGDNICRIFKASTNETLAQPQLGQLLANISDAAQQACKVKARAQGFPWKREPIIEAHPGTGILIVAGQESDVQVVGQIIQVMGGEAVPLTRGVSPAYDNNTPDPTSGRTTSLISPVVMKAKDGTVTEVDPVISGSGPLSRVEDTRKLLEATRDKVKNLEKQLELLSKQQPPTPPKAK